MHGACINAGDRMKQTALMEAAKNDHLRTVQVIYGPWSNWGPSLYTYFDGADAFCGLMIAAS